MSSSKKLFLAIGPFVLALCLLGGIFLLPSTKMKPTEKTMEKASTSMSVNVIKGNNLKNTAIANPYYVPFFGSSELSRVDAFHPSVLAEKYNRPYRPFLLGAAGTQSLSQFLMLQSMSKDLKGKKAVFIISPQWFVDKGVSKEMFALYYSPLQTYQWLMNVREVGENEKYLAHRLLQFPNTRKDTTMKALLKQIARGERLTPAQLKMCETSSKVLIREDELFGHLGLISKDYKIKQKLKQLPDAYNIQSLDQLAFEQGKKQTKGNPYEISNGFYRKRIAPIESSLKNSQEDFDYTRSVEFADFQVVLNEMAKLHMDVMFIIPPVNQKWMDYTGLSPEMLDEFSHKITHQLNSQGFRHVADFTYKRSEPYFMEDTIHLGWRGWVAVDQAVEPFLTNAEEKRMSYRINNDFLTPDWQKSSYQPNDR